MTIKNITLVTATIFLIVGCADSEPVFTSSGKKGHSIDCSGGISTWGECYEEAGELCGARGYRVLEKMGDQESSIGANKHGLFGESSNTRNLIIQCK